MAIGETAQLIVDLRLQDGLSGPITVASAKLTGLKEAAATASGSSGIGLLATAGAKIESAFGKVGTALSHAGSQIGGLIKNVGLLGGAFALFSGVGALKSAIDTASNMALAIEKLTALTGESAQSMSSLLAVFTKFGLTSDTMSQIVGFTEKTLGKLAETTAKVAKAQASAALTTLEDEKLRLVAQGSSTKTIDKLITEQKARDALANATAAAAEPLNKLVALQKLYGVALTDAKGAALPFSQVLLNVADYYDSNATAGQKAALAATVFGRGYAQLIPILQLGSKGIKEAEAAAQSLGLVLTDQNVVDLKNYQEGMRKLGDAVGGLQLQVSLALLPALNDLTANLTSFIATNRGNIVTFFKDAAKWAGDMAAVVQKDVLPAIKAIVGWWQALPGPLKDFLVGAFVAGKVSKFLFDVNIPGTLLQLGVKWAAQAVAGLARDVLGFATGGAVAAGEIEAGMAAGGATAAGEMAGAGTGFGALAGAGILAAAAPFAAIIAGAAALYFINQSNIDTTKARLNQDLASKGIAFNGKYDSNLFDVVNHLQGIVDALTGNAGSYFGATTGARPVPNYQTNMNAVGGMLANPAIAALKDAGQYVDAFKAALQRATGWAGSFTKALQDVEKKTHSAFLRGTGDKNIGSDADTLVKYFESLSSSYFQKPGGMTDLNKDITRLLADGNAARKAGNSTLASKLDADAARLQAIKDKLAGIGATTNGLLARIAAKPTTFISNVYADLSVSVRSNQTQNFRSNLYGRSIAV